MPIVGAPEIAPAIFEIAVEIAPATFDRDLESWFVPVRTITPPRFRLPDPGPVPSRSRP